MQPQNPYNAPQMPPVTQQQPAVAQPFQPQPVNPPAPATPSTANDTDKIEPEWVTQAQQVLSKYAGDPFVQNREFTKLKAEYMQKRYGKAVKTEE